MGIDPVYFLNEMSLDEISSIINVRSELDAGKFTWEKKSKALTKEEVMAKINTNGKKRS